MIGLTKYRKRKFSMNTKEITKTSDHTLTIDAKYEGNAVDYSIYGNIPKSKNLIPYPYPIFVNSTVYTQSGVTFQDLGDGSIMVNGTATDRILLAIIPAYTGYRLLYADYFCLSGCPYAKGNILLRARVNKYSTTNTVICETDAQDYGTTALLNMKRLTNPIRYGYLDERDKIYNNYVLTVEIDIPKDAVIDYQIIKPQLNMGNEPLEFERGYYSDVKRDFLETDGYDNNILKLNKDYYHIKYDNKEYLNYKQNFNETVNGITLTSYTDKILNLNGTATEDANFLLATGDTTLFSKYNEYKIYGASDDVKIYVRFFNSANLPIATITAPTTSTTYFASDIIMSDIPTYSIVRMTLTVPKGTVLNNAKVVPSIRAVDNKYNLITDENNIEIDPHKTYMLLGARDRANFTLTYYKNNEVVNTQTNTPRNLISPDYIDKTFTNSNSSQYKYYQNGKVIFIGKPSIDEYVINDSITVKPNTQYTFFPNTVYMQDIKFVITEYNSSNTLVYTNTYNGYSNDNKTIGYLVSNHFPMNYTDNMSVNSICFRTQSSTSYIKIAITFGDYPLYNGTPKLIEHSDTLYKNLLQYPYYIGELTKSGLTITPNSNNSIKLNGTPTANVGQTIYENLPLDKHKKYILTGGSTDAYLRLIFYKGNKWVNEITSNEWKNSTIIDLEAIDYDYDKITVALFVKQGYVFENRSIYPRLEEYNDTDDIILIEPKDYVDHDTCKLTYTVPATINSSLIKPKLRECEVVGTGEKTINILPYPYTKQFTTCYTQDGITAWVKSNGSIVLNGTCTKTTGKTYIQIAQIKNVPAGTYTISGYPSNALSKYCGITAEAWSSDTVKTSVYWENQNIAYEKRTNTTTDTSMIKVFIFVNAGFSCDNIILKPQIELGSTATSYEKYDSSKSNNKNIIPFPYLNIVNTKTVSGITFTDNFDGTITANGTSTADIKFILMDRSKSSICLQPNKQYILSGSAYNGTSSLNYGIDYVRKGESTSDLGGGTEVINNENNMFTIPNDDWDDFENEQLYIFVNSNTTIDNLTFKPMLVCVDDLPNERKRWLCPYKQPETSATQCTNNGITYTIINDGDVLVTGQLTDKTTGSLFTFRNLADNTMLDNAPYYISGIPDGIVNAFINVSWYSNGTFQKRSHVTSAGGIVQPLSNTTHISCYLGISDGDTTVYNHVFKFKIAKIGYEPYGYKIPFVRKPYNWLHPPYDYSNIKTNGITVKQLPDGSCTMNGSYAERTQFEMRSTFWVSKPIPDHQMFALQDFGKELDISTWIGGYINPNKSNFITFCKDNNKNIFGYVSESNEKGLNINMLRLLFIIYNGTKAYNVRFMPSLTLLKDPYIYTTSYIDKPLKRGEKLNYIDNLLPDLPIDKGINNFYVDTYYKPNKSVVKYIGK